MNPGTSVASDLLKPAHVEDLARSAISAEEAVAVGIRSLSVEELSSRVRFPVESAGFVIPYPDCEAFRVRLDVPHKFQDGREAKYLSAREAAVRLYIPDGVREKLEADRALPLYMPEGEKKTLSVWLRLGFAAVGIPGVWAWKDKGRESGAIEDLEELRPLLKGRLVVLLFDSDARTNPQVALAAWQFAAWLREAGGRARWAFPPLDGAGKKMGIDDLIATKGCDAARALLDGHFEPREAAAFMVQARYEAATEEERKAPFAGSMLYADLRRLLAEARAELRAALAEETRKALDLSIQDRGALLAGLDGGGDNEKDNALQGHAPTLKNPEPWEDAVDGAQILDEVLALLKKYVVLPDHAAEASALWIAHTYALDATHFSPRLAIVSPAKRCGKTTLLDLLSHLALRTLPSCNLSAAVVYRGIEAFHPTLLVDEADTFLETQEELHGVLNAGHRLDGVVLRCEGDDHTPREFSVFGAAAIAMIGRLPGTLEDRSILIQMRRRIRGESIESLRRDRLEASTLPLRRKLARWVADNLETLRAADPPVPEALDDRAADNWRTLLAIADAAGGSWPARGRVAAMELSKLRGEDEDSRGTMLLADLREFFLQTGAERLTTAEIIAGLVAMEERPWSTYYRGNAISPRGVANLLRPYDISPVKWKKEGTTERGYLVTDLSDALSRYLPSSYPPLPPPRTAATTCNESYPPPVADRIPPQAHGAQGGGGSGGWKAGVGATEAAPANGTSPVAGTHGGDGLGGDSEAPSGHPPSSCPPPVADAIVPQMPGVRIGGGSGGGKPGGNGAHSNKDGKDGVRASGHAAHWGWATIPDGWTSGHPLESCVGCGKSASSRDPRGMPRHPWCDERR